MRGNQKNWSRNSLLISLVIHGIFFIFLALYVTGTVTKVQELVDAVFVPESKSQEYEPRPLPVRPVLNPSAPRTQVVDANSIPVDTPERSSPIPGRPAKTSALPKFSDEAMQNAGTPSSLTRSEVTPRVMTTAQVMPSDLTLPPAVAGGSSGPDGVGNRVGGTGGTGAGGGGGGHSRSVLAAIKPPPDRQSLSMINTHTALDVGEGLADVAQGVTLGRERVPPLPRGEPGGIVVGRGKDIAGHIRFTRVKHNLSDWWADPTSLSALMYWMNTQTKIRADINIEGGSLGFDNPKLMKCPLAVMTGHDVTYRSTVQGRYASRLRKQEQTGLRKYLIEAGGLLLYDNCGHDLTLTNMVKSELRTALPEHTLERIPNQHDLYTCYYDMGGAPLGFYKFWRHGQGRYKVGEYLEGIFINERLAAIISDRDYLCAARTRNISGHANKGHAAPSTYRFLTNVIVYSLTHGGISEHTDYVPEITDADRISIDSPVPVPPLAPQR